MAARARATEWLPVRCGLVAGAAARAGGRGSAAKWRQVWGSAGGRRGRALGARTGWTHSARSSLASADGSEAPEVSPGVRLGQGPAVGPCRGEHAQARRQALAAQARARAGRAGFQAWALIHGSETFTP